MDISKFSKGRISLFRQPSVEPDYMVDDWIRAALVEDAAVQPPPGTWECLRKAITDRKLIKGYGMWILDEPLRDPPPSPPTTLTSRQFKRALRIYDDSRGNQIRQVTDAIWVTPTFCALISL